MFDPSALTGQSLFVSTITVGVVATSQADAEKQLKNMALASTDCIAAFAIKKMEALPIRTVHP